MKINEVSAPRRAQIYWLSRQEAEDDSIMRFPNNDFTVTHEQGVMPVVVESGSSYLRESLFMLMRQSDQPERAQLSKAS